MKKQRKFLWPVILVPFLVISAAALYVSLDAYIESQTVSFQSSRLAGYNLSNIEGSPIKIDTDEYSFDTLSSVVGKRVILPVGVNEGVLYYFCYYEKVKHQYYDRYEVFLEWHMTDETFEQELRRLSSLKSVKTIAFSEDTFLQPSYIAEYNFWANFEYAILDRENLTIKYVLLREIGDISNVVFSLDYAPTKLLKNTDLKKIASIVGKFTIYQ